MSLITVAILLTAALIMLIIERGGSPITLRLNFKGDLKRETRWFAQYGQAACTVVAAWLVWKLDGRVFQNRWPAGEMLLLGVFGVSIAATLIKRVLGRVRPNHENAGRFMGPSLRHANYRESFPSSHSACAVAMTVMLAQLYPGASGVFWTLAITCAVLRYLMDAHWPSDVLAGIAIGYAGGHLAWQWMS
jgi:membrane-associated phospholipid phosphatase